ncbi:RecA family ATPase Rhp57, partial [Reticulomyxa filosa]
MNKKATLSPLEPGKELPSVIFSDNTSLEEIKTKLRHTFQNQQKSTEKEDAVLNLTNGQHDDLLAALFDLRPKEEKMKAPLSNPHNNVTNVGKRLENLSDWTIKRLEKEIDETNLSDQYEKNIEDVNRNNAKIVTSHKYLDTNVLNGGIGKREITEICGLSGSGKTPFVMQLALNCAMIPSQLGGLSTYPNTKAVIIDTTQRIKMSRLYEISEHLWKNLNEMMKRRRTL